MTKASQFFDEIAQYAGMVQGADAPGIIMSNEKFMAIAKMLHILRRDISDFSASELEQIADDYFKLQDTPNVP